jgi:hypothetical protein
MAGTKQQDFDIVVSSDNNDYLAWQCLVFHHSCITHLGRAPIIVVHGDDEPLASGYRILEKKGGLIQRLPTQKYAGFIEYAGRNIWATLKGVKTSATNIVLCDPDMIFLRHVDFAEKAATLQGEAISLDKVAYMTVGDHNRSILEEVCRISWININLLNSIRISGGMPYIIPTNLRRHFARELATLTEDCLVTSLKHHGQMNSEVWISVMWGFVLAALRNDISMSLTNMCVANDRIAEEQASILRDRQIVHYCYGDGFFNKKNYMNEDDSLNAVWRACAPDGTVNGAVTSAIQEAAVFYDLA